MGNFDTILTCDQRIFLFLGGAKKTKKSPDRRLTLYRHGKLLEHYLVSSCVSFKYFAFLSVCDKFELLGHVQAAMMI